MRRSTQIASAVRHLATGEVILFPTETVYGLGASLLCLEARRRICQIKRRSLSKPLQILVESLAQARLFVSHWPGGIERLARRFWPGPLTLVLTASHLGRLASGGGRTVGLRVPNHPVALRLIRRLGVPLAATSCNLSGGAPCVSAQESRRAFGSKVAMVLDGGRCRMARESTVVDGTGRIPRLLRPGAIPLQELRRVIPRLRL
ncbi:MAG: threonylcarbamoyl-AMP synthase [Elusimicrobia bacterium]|nr:threonylcarbamoyl-AMP synthase [Elusimicrobiota bacterium]